jgi:hypothetical protein
MKLKTIVVIQTNLKTKLKKFKRNSLKEIENKIESDIENKIQTKLKKIK